MGQCHLTPRSRMAKQKTGPKGASPEVRPVTGEVTPHLPGAPPWTAAPRHTTHAALIGDVSLALSPRAADGVKLKLVNTMASCSIVSSNNFSSVVSMMALGAGQPLQAQPHTHPSADPHGQAPPAPAVHSQLPLPGSEPSPRPASALSKAEGVRLPPTFWH